MISLTKHFHQEKLIIVGSQLAASVCLCCVLSTTTLYEMLAAQRSHNSEEVNATNHRVRERQSLQCASCTLQSFDVLAKT